MAFIFHFIYGKILPIDELIFFKMVKATNQPLVANLDRRLASLVDVQDFSEITCIAVPFRISDPTSPFSRWV